MSSLASIYMKKETLETLFKTLQAKKEKGVELTLSIGEETNEYGQNVTAFVSQSKEERQAKKDRFYVGNGKVFWTDGTIVKAGDKAESVEAVVVSEDDDLPF